MGEIAVRGPNVMKGYWNRPDETRAVLSDDGWLRTGDLARVDEDGAFWIAGRAKDLIIRDGRNVFPREIEDVLQRPSGRARGGGGRRARPRCSARRSSRASCARPAPSVTEEELRDYARDRVAESKYPRRVWFAPALPRSASGKLLKRAIVIPAEIAMPREIAA